MTQVSIHAAEQGFSFNGFVSSALMGAVLFLSAVMFFGQFAA